MTEGSRHYTIVAIQINIHSTSQRSAKSSQSIKILAQIQVCTLDYLYNDIVGI